MFESFWHLDGRIFRTARDLFLPGRIANHYLGGQRVRDVAPMRLFVILTLLTFFIAKLVVQDTLPGVAPDRVVQSADVSGQFARAQNAVDVDAIRNAANADIDEARRAAGLLAGVSARPAAAEAEVRSQARARTVALATDAGRNAPAGTDTAAVATDAAMRPSEPVAGDNRPGHRRDAPTFGGAAGERITRNLDRLQNSPGAYSRAWLGVAPTALFILVPLFAVLLKLAYLLQRRLYLEHVVIGLYSHAALMLGLLLVFRGALATPWLATHAAWAAGAGDVLQTLLLWAMPVYLLLMQKRVHGQSWAWTLLKFAIIGMLYVALFLRVAIPMAGYALYAL